MNLSKKSIIIIVAAIVALVVFSFTNPFSYNASTDRTVVETPGGKQSVRFAPGMFWSGFFAKTTEWPNQISIMHQASEQDLSIHDNSIEIGKIQVRFNDATTADMSGIVQYILPTNEEEMIALHNAHRTPASLVTKRLAPYTKECLQSSAQLMSAEMHYGGGRAQMAQDYLDQLKNGAFLLATSEVSVYDSIDKGNRKTYQTKIQKGTDGTAKRKFSSIKEYGVTVADAQITDVDYQEQVDQMLTKKIEAATAASVSKQQLITAQQQALTAKVQGEKTLVEIEYKQKQDQTVQVVQAQTKVEIAKQDLLQQDIQLQASKKEAEKIKTLADANAYDKQRMIQADGALDSKLEAYKTVQKYWADALSKYTGNIVPTYQTGGSTGNGAINFMDIMGAKAARDLSLDLKNKE